MTEKPIKKVALLIAMEAEAKPLTDKLGLSPNDPSLFPDPVPFKSSSGVVDGLELTVVTLGKCKTTEADNVGTVPAAVATYVALQTLKPDLLINAGTAGGFLAQGSKIGDVYISTQCINHDRHIPIPKFEEYGIGRQSCIDTPKLRESLGLKAGVVSTGNSLDYTEKGMDVMKAHSAAAKDMEAAAIAWTAQLFNVPLFCVKAVTDLVDGERPPQEEFLENLHIASQALQGTMVKVLDFVNGKQHNEL